MSKAKKHLRPCPALGRDITPVECGTGRGSAYRCPAECPFLPFTPANYDEHSEIERRLLQKAFARSAREMSVADRESKLRMLEASRDGEDAELANHARWAWLFHCQRDAGGRTFGERWLAEKTSGLTNDERVLLAGMNAMHPALVEIQRIIDEQTIEGVDLLTGRPLRIIDRGAAGAARRYLALLGWVYPMPHYDRLSGSALHVPDVPQMSPEEIVREVIRHLGGPADSAGERAWLSEHFARVCAALGAVQLARWHDTVAAIDAHYTKTDYRLRKSARLSSRLAARQDVAEETLAEEDSAQGFGKLYVWLNDASAPESHQLALPLTGPPKVAAAPLVLGRVLVGRERVRIEAMTRARHQELRARFERLAAGEVEFLGERTDDLASQTLAQRVEKFDAALVPPRLRERPEQLTLATQRVPAAEGGRGPALLEAFRQQYATFANEPLPALDARTPRAAAADPALRPRLVKLMKMHIRDTDRRRREEGLDLDLNPLLAELSLHELISEPPPLGRAEDEIEDAEIDEEAAEVFGELSALSRGIGPHAVLPPLTEREIEQRLRTMQARYRSPDDAAEAIDETLPGLLDFVFDATQSILDDAERPFLEILVVRACHILRPPAGPPLMLDFDCMVREFAGEFSRVSKIVLAPSGTSAGFERWACDSPQPAVMRDLTGVLFTVTEKLRRKERPRDEIIPAILACVKAVVAELARVRS